MPAPGEQHLNGGRPIPNPFEVFKPHISEYTAQEIANLSTRLEKQLGPEYISSRPGPSGQKIHYITAEKCIQLANEVFGFNGWSSQIIDMAVDFVDELPGGKINVGISCTVRVTLRDGTFHEDVGYGRCDSAKGKAPAFEKAKKSATTDGLKRALRNFGNVLGNCMYDKDYVTKVMKVKVQPAKWDVENLHRHSTYVPNPAAALAAAKREAEMRERMASLEEKEMVNSDGSGNGGQIASLSSEETFEDEFGDFDEADFNVADPDSHPDEVVIPAPAPAGPPRHFTNPRNGNAPAKPPPPNQGHLTRTRSQAAAAQPARPANGPPHIPTNNTVPPQQPQTPNAGFTRSSSGSGSNINAPANSVPQPRPMQPPPRNPKTGHPLNQPSRNGQPQPPSAPASPAPINRSVDDNPSSTNNASEPSFPPQSTGFFSAKSIAKITPDIHATSESGAPTPLPSNLAVFNPHLESPSIPRTPGIDHKSSKPLTRDLKHVISSSQQSPGPAGGTGRPNLVNPGLDLSRRIGAPGFGSAGSGGASPMANRGGYRPPLKRPVDSHAVAGGARMALGGLDANGPVGGVGGLGGGDVKRQKMAE